MRLRAGSSEQVVWRARLVLGCLVLVALCFQRAPGLIVPDSKLELTAEPGGLLGRAVHLWDPLSGFGQLQNDAFGYLLPMGPFHWLLDAVSVPDWITQRLWWSLVLCVAFLGVWKLSNVFKFGVSWARFAVALLYALSLLLLGELSIEGWPIAMAPWVLLPLVTPHPRSGWWRIGWSAVAFALIGGVDPVASAAALVLPAIWVVTRSALKLALGWFGCVLAVSIWWLVPLLLLSRYGVVPDTTHWLPTVGLVVGLPAALAAARYLSRLADWSLSSGVHRRVVPLLVVCLAVSIATPAVFSRYDDAYAAIPAHWQEAASWLDEQPAPGSVLVVPGRPAAGVGPTEPFQALLNRPMAVAGTSDWLAEIEQRLGTGVGDQALRQTLARAGVKYVVVRNDLRYDAAPALAVHESLSDAGIQRVAYFGPAGQTRLPYPSVEIFDVGDTSAGRLIPQSRLVEVAGAANDVPTVVSALGGDRAAVLSADASGRLDGLPLIQTGAAGPSVDRQPSALVFRNPQIGRSACLHVGSRPLCSRSQAADSDEPNGLSRSVELPQAASYRLHGVALPQDGQALEGLLVVPGAITATASSRAVAAPESRPGAAVDRDLGTGWVANPDDSAPSLTLKLPEARSVGGLRFRSDTYLAASRPTEVLLRFDDGAPTRIRVGADGSVRFAARTARTIEVDFVGTTPVGDVRVAPVGVSEVEVLGADDLRAALDRNARIPVYCGNGPAVRVDGATVATELSASVQDLLQRRPVTFSACGRTSEVPVRSGHHKVEVQARGGFVPVEATLTKAGFGDVSVTPVQGADVWQPNPAELTVEVPAADEQSVLTVAQNFNPGWEAYDGSGHRLTPIRIAGWQQGWILPAGQEQVVTARFVPDRAYRAGLLLGLLAVLAVLALAVFARRRPRRVIGRSIQ